jgi:branched-chain amino acid transport system permease protein
MRCAACRASTVTAKMDAMKNSCPIIGYVSPESDSLFLSISFLVGSAFGGIATIGGAIVGGFFIQFVPNLANDISDAAPGAIYGLAMLLFMYAMPRGVVGSLGPWVARSMRQIEQHRVGFRRK